MLPMPHSDTRVRNDREGTHKCPTPGCNAKVPNTLAFCRNHWFAIDLARREAIWASYNAGKAGTVGHIELLNEAGQSLAARGK
jgi:hypothetical protein